VVCFNDKDAMAMASTGFFTQSCEAFSNDSGLIAEYVETRDTAEGPVVMVRTTLRSKIAWVPIPWHDWA